MATITEKNEIGWRSLTIARFRHNVALLQFRLIGTTPTSLVRLGPVNGETHLIHVDFPKGNDIGIGYVGCL